MVGHSWQPSSEDLVRSLRRAYKKEFVLVNVPSAEIGNSKIETRTWRGGNSADPDFQACGSWDEPHASKARSALPLTSLRVSTPVTSLRTVSAGRSRRPAARQDKRPPSPTRRD